MSTGYDPFKPWSEKNAADFATDYYIYEQVTKDGSGGSGDTPPPTGDGKITGCGTWVVIFILLLLLVAGISSCGDHTTSTHHYTTHYYSTTTTTHFTTSYTTRAGTTRDDPYDTGSYVDADDFAADNWEEFDDYDEAYDYYEDYEAGYE